jgi:hypothetical protein
MVWELSPPWDMIIAIGAFMVMGIFVFWNYLSVYERRYFHWKGHQLALVKTVAWLIFYGGSFGLVFWLVSLGLSPGWLRYLVGGGVWWLLSETVLGLSWPFVDQALDNLFG